MQQIKKYLGLFFLVVFTFGFMQAHAVDDPVALVQSTADNAISSLKAQGPNLSQQQANSIVRRILLPKVDVVGMSRYAVGGRTWKSATATQKKDFMGQFVTLVVRTYASALAQYTNQTVKVYPIRGGYQDKRLVQVQSVILQQGGPSIPVNYRLVKEGATWKLYDFSVDGISMVQSFRSQFSSILNQGGMQALIDQLKQHNAGNKTS
ncbi:MAG: phospholipid-binding protein MlaC [Gammaproteobacteria bacterium]